MSETLQSPEQHEALAQSVAEQLEVKRTVHERPAKPEKDPKQAAHEARKAVHESTRGNKHPNPLERLEAAEKTPRESQPQHINRELKRITLQRELQSVRRKLPAAQRLLSKVIHQPAIRAVSETAGKTVSRPSGLLGGGLVAFLGTSAYLYLAKHLGFEYEYSVFLVLFVGGFVVGLVLELLVHAATVKRRRLHD